MSETCAYIESFYELTELKEPNKVFCIRNSSRLNKTNETSNLNVNSDAADYFNPENNTEIDEMTRGELLNRNLARKYINMR